MSTTHHSARSRDRRVLRLVPKTYDEVNEHRAVEHGAWRERQRRALIDGGWSKNHSGPAVLAVDALGTELLEVTLSLHTEYGTPDLGNKSDPVDELVYIILSRRTREGAYQAAFESLKSRYAAWEDLAAAPIDEVRDAVAFSGLGRRKAQSLKLALLALIDRFGSCTLEPTLDWDDAEVLDFLCSLPEVGPKSAACIMLCSLDRPAFPVDAHVGRVLERMGTFRSIGIELESTDHKVKQRLLWDVIPPALRYPLHVNALVHGRLTCLPGRPRCGQCVLAERCDFASRTVLGR